MFDLQTQLNKRLADLKQKDRIQPLRAQELNPTQIKAALTKSGIVSKSGKILTLTT